MFQELNDIDLMSPKNLSIENKSKSANMFKSGKSYNHIQTIFSNESFAPQSDKYLSDEGEENKEEESVHHKKRQSKDISWFGKNHKKNFSVKKHRSKLVLKQMYPHGKFEKKLPSA